MSDPNQNTENSEFDPQHDPNDAQFSSDELATDEALGETAGDETVVSRDEEMESLRRTAEEADKRVLQAQAEAENFRKRMRRDFEDQLRYASLPMVADLLQVRDNLLRAIDAAETGDDGLKEGVQMVVKMLDDTLAKYGITEIAAEGQSFDPNVHEAISQMESPSHESGEIVHVATAGFKMHDRVIRPSQVVVAS